MLFCDPHAPSTVRVHAINTMFCITKDLVQQYGQVFNMKVRNALHNEATPETIVATLSERPYKTSGITTLNTNI